MNEGEESWIYYFHGYIGYFVLGYYLSVKDNIFNRFKYSKTFLILLFIFVMHNVLWEIEWMKEMDAILQIVVCALLTLVISVLISFVISKVKYLRIIIRY